MTIHTPVPKAVIRIDFPTDPKIPAEIVKSVRIEAELVLRPTVSIPNRNVGVWCDPVVNQSAEKHRHIESAAEVCNDRIRFIEKLAHFLADYPIVGGSLVIHYD